MRLPLTYIAVPALLVVISALTPLKKHNHVRSPENLDWLRHEAVDFVVSAEELESAIAHIDDDHPATIETAKQSLKECRLRYTRLAFFLEYFYPEKARLFNAPPKPEVHEPDLGYDNPTGLQVMETVLYDKDPSRRQEELVQQAHLMLNAAVDVPALFSQTNVNDSQLLESFRLELIRIMTLYITGYDAPVMKTGIAEADGALSVLAEGISPYLDGYSQKDSLRYYLLACRKYLQENSDFDSFDRLFFLTRYALPLQYQVTQLAVEKRFMLNTAPALNVAANNLFSAYAFNKRAFPYAEDDANALLADLGKKLFSEKALSGDYSRSCATCHDPGRYFMDGMAQNRALDGKNFLPRNTPTLLYAAYQYSQFWDGRASGLKAQIATVLNNSNEMNGRDDSIVNRLQRDSFYLKAFKKVWPVKDYYNGITVKHILSAIVAYVQTLAPFQSSFDKYMQGDWSALSTSEQRGFNLFMGKAACGTCHFAPLFNGLTPPLYDGTEYEVLGTPADDSLEKPRPDNDKGRYAVFAIRYYDGAFKTPTVRNAAVTAPYMHNGKFRTLDKVIAFYDKGGGIGLGLNVPGQTLLPTALHLSEQEKKDLISFIGALTDKNINR
ncbi:MAG TPA: cytochrome c peroxidase [Puia sp.]|nr:cytochrome c peroxidase [Puia sp.]